MTKGRRSAGMCGACLLLAARMNNFRRSLEKIIQVVKIADPTLRKRLKRPNPNPSSYLSPEKSLRSAIAKQFLRFWWGNLMKTLSSYRPHRPPTLAA
ncbi:hypothetical protein F5888DRAFT_737439 [Russula emetica]|nr:hypothetical protein F5888DRAFT_737439 [Russula emetica]